MIWFFYLLLPISCYIIGVICGRLSVSQPAEMSEEEERCRN